MGSLVGDLSVEFDGLVLSGSVAHGSHLQSVKQGRYEPFTTRFFKRLMGPGKLVLDIGAYVGYYTLLAAKAGAKVYSFEPNPASFKYIVRNAQANGFQERVIAVPKAVSDKNAMVSFFLSRDQSSLFHRSSGFEEVVVECARLDDLLSNEEVVDFIKMDVEGAELHALQGMEQTLARAGDGLCMVVECNPRKLRSAGSSAGALLDRLKALGFIVRGVDRRRGSYYVPDASKLDSGHSVNPYSVNLFCARWDEVFAAGGPQLT